MLKIVEVDDSPRYFALVEIPCAFRHIDLSGFAAELKVGFVIAARKRMPFDRISMDVIAMTRTKPQAVVLAEAIELGCARS